MTEELTKARDHYEDDDEESEEESDLLETIKKEIEEDKIPNQEQLKQFLSRRSSFSAEYMTLLPEKQKELDRKIIENATKTAKEEFDTLWRESKRVVTLLDSPRKVNPVSKTKLSKRSESFNEVIKTSEKQNKSFSVLPTTSQSLGSLNLSALEPIAPKRRSQSLDFQHSWDFVPFFWDEQQWKEKVQKRRNKHRSALKTNVVKKRAGKQVRFEESVVDNGPKIIETDMSLFGEIPYEERDHIDDADEKKGHLIFETITTSSGNKKVIVAGMLEKLVSRLADQRLPDSDYIKEFFYGFRGVLAPIKLLTMLIERYDFNPPANPTLEDIEYHKKYDSTVKLRVVNVLKKWMINHYYDFIEENRVFNKMKSFIDDKISKTLDGRWALQLRLIIQERHVLPFPLPPDSPFELIEVTAKRPDSGILFSTQTYKKVIYNMCFWGFQLQNWMVAVMNLKPAEAGTMIEKMIESNIVFPLDPKEKLFKKSVIYRFVNKPGEPLADPLAPATIQSVRLLKFHEIHPLEVARQLSLISHGILTKITSRELTDFVKIGCSVKAVKVPWIDRVYSRTREVAFWVASEIVLCANAHQRQTVLKRFLQVAEYCSKMQNWSDLSAIIGGLRLHAVTRLQKTWKALPKKKHKLYQELLNSLRTEAVRDRMRKAHPPYIPIFDLYTRELAEISQQPDVVEEDMINFRKIKAVANVFEEIERVRNGSPYPFKPVPNYQNYLLTDAVILSEHDLLYYSQECEPDAQYIP